MAVSGDSALQLGKGVGGFYPIETYSRFAHKNPVKSRQKWTHVVIVVDGKEIRFYIDGKMTHQLARLEEPVNVCYEFRGTRLGAHPAVDNPNYAQLYYHFLGHLDEIRMSSVARYHDEFVPATRFHCDADTLALYHRDEGSGNELRDGSGYNHHGVVVDVAWKSHAAADLYSIAARLQEHAAQQFSLPVDISNKTGMTLRLIPPGEFLMGAPDSDAEASPEEKPQHLVRLTRPFYMGTTEVTVGQFRQFVEATSYVTQAESDGNGAFQQSRQIRGLTSPARLKSTPLERRGTLQND